MLLDGYQREKMEGAIMNDYSGIVRCTERKESIVDRYAEGYRQGYKDGREDAKNEMKFTWDVSLTPAIVSTDKGTSICGGQNDNR